MKVEVSGNSLDAILGLTGGLAGILWIIGAFFIGGYQEFRLNNSVFNELYSSLARNEASSPSKVSPEEAIKGRLEAQRYFSFQYWEVVAGWFLSKFSCLKDKECCKKVIERYETYEQATELCNKELDVQRIILDLRLSEFMAETTLKKYQRILINHSKVIPCAEKSKLQKRRELIDPIDFAKNEDKKEKSDEQTEDNKEKKKSDWWGSRKLRAFNDDPNTPTSANPLPKTGKVCEEFDRKFNPQEDERDLLIMYLMTNQKPKGPKSQQFFADYAKVGGDE